MPLRNRVTPRGLLEADPARGDFMGNRGILHGEDRRLGKRRWAHKTWIICRTEFRGRRRRVMTPHRYTELFFLDEAVAVAAGHRPCYECRRQDFRAWQAAWQRAAALAAPPRAGEMDAVLHRERIDPETRRQRVWESALDPLPDGTFVLFGDVPHLVRGGDLLPWRHAGYGAARPRPHAAHVPVLTPPAAVAALRAGFRPRLHASASPLKI